MRFKRKLKIFTSVSILTGLSAVAFSGSVFAAESFTWSFTSGCSANCSGSTSRKTFEPTSDTTPTVTASAWANTGPNGSNNRLYEADLNIYSGGTGVRHADGESTSSPNHATDNNGRYELVVYDFGAQSVALTEVAISWWYNDADITILRYAGDLVDPRSVFNSTPYGVGVEYLTEAYNAGTGIGGWVNEGNIDVDGIGTNGGRGGYATASFNADKDASNYWIVAAYNTAFGTCDSGSCENGHSSDYDYFKIKKLTGEIGGGGPPTGGVPAPPTFLLMTLGLAWLGRKHLKSA